MRCPWPRCLVVLWCHMSCPSSLPVISQERVVFGSLSLSFCCMTINLFDALPYFKLIHLLHYISGHDILINIYLVDHQKPLRFFCQSIGLSVVWYNLCERIRLTEGGLHGLKKMGLKRGAFCRILHTNILECKMVLITRTWKHVCL